MLQGNEHGQWLTCSAMSKCKINSKVVKQHTKQIKAVVDYLHKGNLQSLQSATKVGNVFLQEGGKIGMTLSMGAHTHAHIQTELANIRVLH